MQVKVYAYFACPDTSNENEIYCCGMPTEQYCCTYSEYDQQTMYRSGDSMPIWGIVIITLVLIILVVLGIVALKVIYDRFCMTNADLVVADTVVYAPPAEQVQVVETTTIVEEKRRSRHSSSSSEGQPMSPNGAGSAQNQLGGGPPMYPYPTSGPVAPPYPSSGAPPYSTPGSQVPMYSTPGSYPAPPAPGPMYPQAPSQPNVYGAGYPMGTSAPPYPSGPAPLYPTPYPMSGTQQPPY